jgi:hypothetical protein
MNFELIAAVTMNIIAFWEVIPYDLDTKVSKKKPCILQTEHGGIRFSANAQK